MTELTKNIAQFIADTSLRTIPPIAFEKAKKSIADTFGVILAGAGSEVAPPLLRYVAESGTQGSIPLLGTNLTVSPEMAAFVNGIFGHALDFDDVLSMMVAHPSSVIVAAALANTGRTKISGRKLLEAYIIGVEVGAKIGLGITVGHFARGFHSQGTLCIFSALAALAKLQTLDVRTTQTAFGIAGSMTSGLRRNIGTMTKPLHAGWAARSAWVATNLARHGFTAALDVLEAKTGFYAAFGAESSDPMVTRESLGRPWAVVDPGIALKRFPCCYASHRAMDGILTLKQKLKLTADTLEHLECRYPPGGTIPVGGYPEPKTGLEGKFSLQYSLAAGVLDGGYRLWTFTDEAVNRPAIKPLLKKITVEEHPRCANNDPLLETRSFGSRGFVEVEVRTTDGREDMLRIDHPPGHPTRELGWSEIQAKFMDCATQARIDAGKAESAFERLRNLGECNDINQIVALLRPISGT